MARSPRSRRRGALAGTVLAAAVLLCASSPAAVGVTVTPKSVCTITDQGLRELSGLAADGENWYAVNDGGNRIDIFVLDRACSVRRVLTAPIDPYDVEDLARSADGTLWLADTGDNRLRRDTVALHKVTRDGHATLYRLTYPDGPHDAEALLLDRSGVPHVVTKHALGQSEIYRPASALRSPGPTPLEKVGEVTISPTTTTGGPVGGTGTVLVTGGAVSADGTVIALRTYTDVYLYSAPDGDVLAALRRDPVRAALPNEDQGEAIAFEPDGTLLSAGEGVDQKVRAISGAADLVAHAPHTTLPRPDGATGEGDGDHSGPTNDADSPAMPVLAVALMAATALLLVLGKRLRRR
ncbi:MAG: hypothetical protein ACRDQ7_24810 [Haloechinothrix sp.]